MKRTSAHPLPDCLTMRPSEKKEHTMKSQTTTSSQIDDIEKARHLAFNPTLYDAIRAGTDDDTSGFWNPNCLSGQTTGTRLIVNFDASTKATTRESINQTVQVLGASGLTVGDLDVYIVGSYCRDESKETLPTNDPESSLSDLIDLFRHYPKMDFAERIAARLDYLLEVSREEQPEQAPPAAGSLDSFLAFLTKNPGLAYPDIVLTFDGNVRAEWTHSSNEHFAIEFCEDGNVRFVIFAPDPKHPYKTSRVSGTATIDSVVGLAEHYQVSRWVRLEGMQAA